MTADYDQAVRRHIIDLHEERGELRALIEMVVETGHLLIENIAVRPDQQGKGIGDRLLHHAEVVATSLDLRESTPMLRLSRTWHSTQSVGTKNMIEKLCPQVELRCSRERHCRAPGK